MGSMVAHESASSVLADYSLEITAKDADALEEAAADIAPGTQVSVTFLPGEEQESRVAAARRVKQLGFVPVPHISARRLSSEAELDSFLDQLASDVGIEHAFVVAGDPANPMGPYEDALAVIRTGKLAAHGVRSVGISGYPEGHPDISSDKLWAAMTDKAAVLGEMGLGFEVMTQFAFDEEPVLAWLEQVRARGIVAPVRVGLPGPASVRTLLRFAARCGVGASAKVMLKYGTSIARLLDTTGPDRLVESFAAKLDPARHGDVRFHVYPFGGLKKAARWCAENV